MTWWRSSRPPRVRSLTRAVIGNPAKTAAKVAAQALGFCPLCPCGSLPPCPWPAAWGARAHPGRPLAVTALWWCKPCSTGHKKPWPVEPSPAPRRRVCVSVRGSQATPRAVKTTDHKRSTSIPSFARALLQTSRNHRRKRSEKSFRRRRHLTLAAEPPRGTPGGFSEGKLCGPGLMFRPTPFLSPVL